MKKHRLLTRLASVALTGLVAVPASAAIVPNGGFESPDIASWTLKSPGDTGITGWTVVGNTISFQDSAAFGGLGVVASEGSQFLELTGIVGRGGGVRSDPFSTVNGTNYRLQFDIGAFFVAGQGSYGDVIVDLWIDGVARGSFTNLIGLSGPGSDWETETFDFIAAGATTTLEFRSSLSTASSDLGVGLDNIRMTELAAVSSPLQGLPEPTSALLLAAGLTGLGGIRRFARR